MKAGKITRGGKATLYYGTRWQRFLARIVSLKWLVALPGESCIRVRQKRDGSPDICVHGCSFGQQTGSIYMGGGTVRLSGPIEIRSKPGRLHTYSTDDGPTLGDAIARTVEQHAKEADNR